MYIFFSQQPKVVKQEMARVKIDILGISELKWTRMGEFNSEDDHVYYCRQESLRRNGVALTVNKSLKCHIICLLRNLHAGQEAAVRTRCGTTDWLQVREGVQGSILSPCLFNVYAEYIMQNAGLDESLAGIKNVQRNIKNLINADDKL